MIAESRRGRADCGKRFALVIEGSSVRIEYSQTRSKVGDDELVESRLAGEVAI